jgi:hypothetical protein
LLFLNHEATCIHLHTSLEGIAFYCIALYCNVLHCVVLYCITRIAMCFLYLLFVFRHIFVYYAPSSTFKTPDPSTIHSQLYRKVWIVAATPGAPEILQFVYRAFYFANNCTNTQGLYSIKLIR